MELIEPGAVHGGIAAVPTEVMVVGNGIGDVDILLIHIAHGNNCHGGGTGLVQLVAQIVENMVVLQQIGILGILHGDLVGQTPDNDGGMVVILDDQLLHLVDGVLAAAGHMLGNIGNFRPDDLTVLVAQIVEILIMLIVGQTDGSSAHLTDVLNIFLMMLGQQSVADAPAVLMAADTAQGVSLTIENEALFGMDLIAAAAETGADTVDSFAVLYRLYLGGVEVGILAAMPQMYIGDLQRYAGIGAISGCHHVAFLVQQGITQALAQLAVGDIYLHVYLGILACDDGSDLNAGAAVIIQRKVGLGNTDDVDITVQTAIEGKVSDLRIDLLIGSIVYCQSDHGLQADLGSDIAAPCGVATVVMGKLLAVNVQIGRRVGTTDLDVIALGFGQLLPIQLLGINGSAAVVIVAAVLAIQSIPGMRQVHKIPLRINGSRDLGGLLGECPLAVDIGDMTHGYRSS